MKFAALFAVACLVAGCGPTSSSGTDAGSGKDGGTRGPVPAGAQPVAKTTKAPPNMTFGKAPATAPTQMSAAPPSQPMPPASTTLVQQININITNVTNLSFTDPDGCAALNLSEGQGYCSVGNYVSYCSGGVVHDLDCGSYGAGVVCGYSLDSSGSTVSCLDADPKVESTMVTDESSDAFQTAQACSADEEGTGECEGTDIVVCSSGIVWALDCSEFVASDGTAASCGVNTDGYLDCLWE
jgi:hypothetical protein